MAVSFVQTNNANGTGTTQTCAYNSNVTAGNGLVVFISVNQYTATISSISDTNTNSFVLAGTKTNSAQGVSAWCYYVKSNSATHANTVSVTVSGDSGGFIELQVYEVGPGSGNNEILLDQFASATGADVAVSIGPTATLTTASEFAAAYVNINDNPNAVESGWTEELTSASNLGQYEITTATTALTATNSVFSDWTGLLATFYGSIASLRPTLVATSISAVTAPPLLNPLRPTLTANSNSSFSIQSLVPGTPTLVQHVATGMDCNGVINFKITLPNAALSGNCLILGVQYSSTGSISSVTDNNGGNTWTAGPSATNSTYSQKMALYYALNVAAGTQTVTVAFSGLSGVNTIVATQGVLSEFYNIATSNAVDGTAVSSSTSVSPGTITTTQAGDLIYYWGIGMNAFTNAGLTNSGPTYNGTSIAAGSGFTLLSADLSAGSCDQYQVQSSAGAISPTCTPSGSLTWGSVAIAFKSTAAGTAPSAGIRIVHVQHQMIGSNSTSSSTAPLPLQFPCTGNLLVGLFNYCKITGVSDSAGNTWSYPTDAAVNNTSLTNQWAQIVYAANATTSPTLHSLTLTLGAGATSGDTFQSFLVLYDVTGASVSPYDHGGTNTGNQTANGNLSTVSVTPTTSNGLVFGTCPIDYHTLTGLVGTGYISDIVVNTQDDDNPGASGTSNSTLDEDNGYGHVYNTNTSALTFVWSVNTSYGTNPGVGYWASSAAAFKEAFRLPPTVVSTSSAYITILPVYRPTLVASSTSNVTILPSVIIPVVSLSNSSCAIVPVYVYLALRPGFTALSTTSVQLIPPFVQANSAYLTAATSAIHTIFEGAQTAGNLNVAWILSNGSESTPTVSDTANGNYQLAIGPVVNVGLYAWGFYCPNIGSFPAGENIVTASFSANAAELSLFILEYTSITGLSPLDTTNSNVDGVATISVTTTNANDVISTFFADEDGGVEGAGPGFTERLFSLATVAQVDEAVVSGAGTYTDTPGGIPTDTVVALAAAFKRAYTLREVYRPTLVAVGSSSASFTIAAATDILSFPALSNSSAVIAFTVGVAPIDFVSASAATFVFARLFLPTFAAVAVSGATSLAFHLFVRTGLVAVSGSSMLISARPKPVCLSTSGAVFAPLYLQPISFVAFSGSYYEQKAVWLVHFPSVSSAVFVPLYLSRLAPVITSSSTAVMGFLVYFSMIYPTLPASSISSASFSVRRVYRPTLAAAGSSSAPISFALRLPLPCVSASSAAFTPLYVARIPTVWMTASNVVVPIRIRIQISCVSTSNLGLTYGTLPQPYATSFSSASVQLRFRIPLSILSVSSFAVPIRIRIPIGCISLSSLGIFSNTGSYFPAPKISSASQASVQLRFRIPLSILSVSSFAVPIRIRIPIGCISLSNLGLTYGTLQHPVATSFSSASVQLRLRTPISLPSVSSATFAFVALYRAKPILSSASSFVINTRYWYTPRPSIASTSWVLFNAGTSHRLPTVSLSSAIAAFNARTVNRPTFVSGSSSGTSTSFLETYRPVPQSVSTSIVLPTIVTSSIYENFSPLSMSPSRMSARLRVISFGGNSHRPKTVVVGPPKADVITDWWTT